MTNLNRELHQLLQERKVVLMQEVEHIDSILSLYPELQIDTPFTPSAGKHYTIPEVKDMLRTYMAGGEERLLNSNVFEKTLGITQSAGFDAVDEMVKAGELKQTNSPKKRNRAYKLVEATPPEEETEQKEPPAAPSAEAETKITKTKGRKRSRKGRKLSMSREEILARNTKLKEDAIEFLKKTDLVDLTPGELQDHLGIPSKYKAEGVPRPTTVITKLLKDKLLIPTDRRRKKRTAKDSNFAGKPGPVYVINKDKIDQIIADELRQRAQEQHVDTFRDREARITPGEGVSTGRLRQ